MLKENIRRNHPEVFEYLKAVRGLVRGRFPKVKAFSQGRYPHSFAMIVMRLSARKPQTFTQKIKYKLVYDRRSLLATLSDKWAVREYVAKKVGAEYLPQIYEVISLAGEVNWEKLPHEFVAKSTHGSGASIIVWEGAPEREFPQPNKGEDWRIHLVKPRNLDKALAEMYFSKWMGQRFEFGVGRNPEWSYRNVPPRVIFEELLLTPEGKIPCDFKFLCFDGVCKLIEHDCNRFSHETRDLYSPDWVRIEGSVVTDNSTFTTPRPENLLEMIRIAETLSQGIDFVSVDLYSLGERIVFGEMTNCPGGGLQKFSPNSLERWLGSQWTLPVLSNANTDTPLGALNSQRSSE